eukprot:maker-scaffold879_size85478-snap-gene-0.15 protein:Tk11980 transcript:maker-scaffold879_size85478-snap-gene-0.15-mRNA-1 annotation:"coactosin-like protein"
MSSAEVLDMNGHSQNGLHQVKDSASSSSSSDESSSSEEASNSTSSSSPAVVSPVKPQAPNLEESSKNGSFGNDGEPEYKPRKHNMATNVDRDAIREAYDDVRADTSDTEWAVFIFDGTKLGLTAKGIGFADFKEQFGNDARGFGYIRIKTGDEMSKRAKFVLVTWVGPEVSVMKKAKMSTDKALMKDIVQNFSVELQLENHGEFSHELFKVEVDKAAGARYGTGVRDL